MSRKEGVSREEEVSTEEEVTKLVFREEEVIMDREGGAGVLETGGGSECGLGSSR